MLNRKPAIEELDDFDAVTVNQTWAIFLVSAAGLFLEMMLIRWIGAEIRIFAYLQNTILVVCFLGLGMGCFTCRSPVRMQQLIMPLMLLCVLMAIPFTRYVLAQISQQLSVLNDHLIWFNVVTESPLHSVLNVVVGLGMTFVLMLLVWQMFVPLGRLLGRLMDDHPRTILAYSVNVAGSLVGIWLFVLLSALHTSPVAWFAAVTVLLFVFLGQGRQRALQLGTLTLTVLISWFTVDRGDGHEIVWSPYQKLELADVKGASPTAVQQKSIRVNNVGYQGILDLRDEAVRLDPDISPEMYGYSQYDIPTMFHPRPERVLIVGTGSGNDVAGVLRGGAEHVTAVEIDPAIIEMGQQHHPERPYDSPRVRVVNNDARSFFATTNEQYDLIVFGLLDSHTMNAMTNARLDHYVYTKESIARASSLLRDGGVMVLSFEATKLYIADRMARVLLEIFGWEPVTFRIPMSAMGWGGVLFVSGDQQVVEARLARQPPLVERIEAWQRQRPIELSYTTSVIVDDWPYIYLESRRIPTLFLLLSGMMVVLFVYCSRRRLGSSINLLHWHRTEWHFFFLGAAFLLLEVQNISKAAVVFGNTWSVNAIIISGILTMILLANLIASWWPRLSQRVVGGCLVASCLILYFIDLSSFALLPFLPKAVIVGGLTTVPMLFSGLLFIRSFAAVARKDVALGANLLGALCGGLLQAMTFVTGIKALLLVVAALYSIAILLRPLSVRGDECRIDQAGADDGLAEPAEEAEWAAG